MNAERNEFYLPDGQDVCINRSRFLFNPSDPEVVQRTGWGGVSRALSPPWLLSPALPWRAGMPRRVVKSIHGVLCFVLGSAVCR